MKIHKKLLAVALATLMLGGVLAGCGKDTTSENPSATPVVTDNSTGDQTDNPTVTPGNTGSATPLVVGYSSFSGKFSSFFAETAYDQDASAMTQASILTMDRTGAIVFNAIEGETISYNGTDYLYRGPANLDIDYDEAADTTTYTWTLRQDMKFSDGEPVTADDLIFSLYMFCDPSFTGPATLGSLNILGITDYKLQTPSDIYDKYDAYFDQILDLGRDHGWSSADAWSEEVWNGFWAIQDEEKELWLEEIQGIINYHIEEEDYRDRILGSSGFRLPLAEEPAEGEEPVYEYRFSADDFIENEGLQVAVAMIGWGFGGVNAETGILTAPSGATWDLVTSFPTVEDYYFETYEAYGGDALEFSTAESANGTVIDNRLTFIQTYGPTDPSLGGTFEGVPNIAGIKKVNDYEVTVTVAGYDAAAVYRMGIDLCPLHYYGDRDLYDYENNMFGFEFGDMSLAQAKIGAPMGAGPYIFESFENKVIYYSANSYYYLGEPKIKQIQFKETANNDKIPGIATGTVDITDPSFGNDQVNEIMSFNSNGQITGDVIATNTVNNLGYGYIGINADEVNVGGTPASEESKNLRKAFATMFAVYRDLGVDSFYGERASVINYPISNTSWAAPQKTDQGYEVAFSRAVDGSPIYTASMTAEETYAAALEAAKDYLIAAGYTFDSAAGIFTAAPEGASLEYEIIIPAEGNGSHPSFFILASVKEAMATIGINLIINDPADSNVLWDALDAGTQEMWCAAWGATIDPDMYQVYHSSNVVGTPGASESNHYHIRDAELDELMFEARKSEDQEFRRATYKACLDIILEWAVEIPYYQRLNCYIFSPERVNMDTMTPDITTFYSWMREIENVEMN